MENPDHVTVARSRNVLVRSQRVKRAIRVQVKRIQAYSCLKRAMSPATNSAAFCCPQLVIQEPVRAGRPAR